MYTTDQYTAETWWQGHDADTFYSWQTGNDEWQHFTALQDAEGDYVTFDPPLMLTYTHTNANDANWSDGDPDVPNNGKKFNLDYDGFELHIPWQFSEDAGDWIPMFNLADGATLESGGVEYVVKGIEQALIMTDVTNDDPPAAAALVMDETISAPTLTYDATITDEIGALPEDAEIPSGVGENSIQLLVVAGEDI